MKADITAPYARCTGYSSAHSRPGSGRRQRQHPIYTQPELLAIRPNEVWSWDITKVKGPIKWSHFHLFVILDIFSRYVVGWHDRCTRNRGLAEQLIADTVAKQNIDPGTLTLACRPRYQHALQTRRRLCWLISTSLKLNSRPHVSDDNPFSEAQFKTLKYRPDFPPRFGSIEDARAHCRKFFPVVQHGASSQRHRLYDATHRALR